MSFTWDSWDHIEMDSALSRLHRMIYALAKEGKLNDLRKAIINHGEYHDLASWVNNNEMNQTPLLVASYNNHPSIVKYLIAEGGDIHSEGGFAGNLLRSACKHCNISLAQQLIELGYSSKHIMGRECIIRTALIDCIQWGPFAHDERSIKLLKILIRLPGVNINAKVEVGNSVLIAACDGHRPEHALILLTHPGVDVNAQNEKGLSALMCAARGGSRMTEVVKALLGHPDIDVTLCDVRNQNALQIARSALYVDTQQNIELLERAMSELQVPCTGPIPN